MLFPQWSQSDIDITLNQFQKVNKEQMILALGFIGQQFIKDAREKGDYQDQTGNLRSSIGYAIYDNGIKIESVFETAKKDEDGQGVKSGIDEAAKSVTRIGICLIVVAGMEYAAAVESKGRNVLTIFAPSEGSVKADLEKLLQYV